MSQKNYVIPDQTGLAFLVDLNETLQAAVTNNSGTTEPTTMYGNMWWADTGTSLLKRRNPANTAWVAVMPLTLAISTFGASVASATTAALARTALGIGTVTDASFALKVTQTSSTGSARLPTGTQAQRDASPVAGSLRFNSSIGKPEVFNGTSWGSVGGGATGGGSDEVFVQNSQEVTVNYTIPVGKNASAVGPITVPDGVSITVSSGSRWIIL